MKRCDCFLALLLLLPLASALPRNPDLTSGFTETDSGTATEPVTSSPPETEDRLPGSAERPSGLNADRLLRRIF